MTTQDRSEKNRRLAQIVAQFRTAMLVNTDRDGSHRARPLTIANRDANEPAPAAPGGGQSPQQVTFITSRQRGLVDDLVAEPSVCVTMQDGPKFVCLAGSARVNGDRARLRALWNPTFDLWFRGGPDDPEVVLIDCDIDFAEYWDGSGIAGERLLAAAVRASATDDAAEAREAARHGALDPSGRGGAPGRP
jgi:general stress protein 26